MLDVRFGIKLTRLNNTYACVDDYARHLQDKMKTRKLDGDDGLTMDITQTEGWSTGKILQIGVTDPKTSRRMAMDVLSRGIGLDTEKIIPLILDFLARTKESLTQLKDVPLSLGE